MKQFITLWLTLLLCFVSNRSFAHNFEVDGIYYRYLSKTDNTVGVTYKGDRYNSYSDEYSGDVVIPASVTHNGTTYSVTSIWGEAFKGCIGLTSIEVPNSVTSIGGEAFSNCTGLTSIEIPNSVTSIGVYTFSGCTGLTSIVIPCSVTSIEEGAFSSCTGLTNIEIPNSVTSIGQWAFYGCTGIQSLTIGIGVTSIGSSAFSNQPAKTIWLCNTTPSGYSNAAGKVNYVANNNFKKLSNVTVYPYLSSIFEVDGVKYVPINPSARTCDAIDCTYSESDSIIEIKETVLYKGIAMNIENVKSYCCSANSNIKKVRLEGVEGDVNDYAFQNCTGIKTAIVSNNGDIGKSAFYGNTSLQFVQISKANNLGESAFDSCSALETVIVDIKGDIGQNAFQKCKKMQSAQLGDRVKSIGNYAFYGCWALAEIVIPNETKSIGTYCFSFCSSMQKAALGESIKTVPEYAFSNCTRLQDITIGPNVSTIGQYAFQNCSTLPQIVISSAVSSIRDNAFSGCRRLKRVVIEDRKTTLTLGTNGSSPLFADCSLDSVYIGGEISCTGLRRSPFYGNTSLRAVVITDVVTAIYQDEFSGCTNLKSVQIGDGVETIGDYAFSGCKTLAEIVIPDATMSIGTYCFSDCSTMRKVVLGDGIKTVPKYAFLNCSTLPQIVIPSVVTSIDNYAFSGCKGLKNVVINDRKTALTLGSNGSSPLFADCSLDSVYIGGKISYKTGSSYGYSPFYRNKSLRTVVITDEETQIYDNEFYGCTGLKNVKVGNGVESIGNYAFSGCSSLNCFAFGEGMKSIGKEAFSDCTALTEIYSTAEVPPTCGSQALEDINKWNCTLYVPQQNIEAYQAANQWKDFFFICANADAPQYYTLTYIVDGEVYQTFNIKEGKGITPLDEPVKEGYTFSGWSEIPATMPDNDVTVTGTFIVNTHDIIYMVDGEEYLKVENVAFGTTLTAIDAPTKEGYTFSGWSEIPATMPDNDVTVTGTFIVNTHSIIYMVDGEEYLKVENVAFGTTLTAIDAPTKEGYIFSGWSEIPEVMPDHDVTVTGSFTEVSGLDTLTADDATLTPTYSIQGTRTSMLRQGGLYIRDGKRVILK